MVENEYLAPMIKYQRLQNKRTDMQEGNTCVEATKTSSNGTRISSKSSNRYKTPFCVWATLNYKPVGL